MTDKRSSDSRRKLLKSIASGSGAIVAGKSLPESWSRPVVDSVMLPVHAQTSPTTGIDDVTLQSTTLQINGPSIPYTATLTNAGATTLSIVTVQAWVDQGATSRAGGGAQVTTCGPALGDFQPGTCTFNFTINANDITAAGSGTFVAGAATARFELKDDGIVLDTYTVPVTLIT